MYDLLGCVSTHPPEEAATILGSRHSQAAVSETLGELAALRSQGFLSEEVSPPTTGLQGPLVNLTLNVAHRCNLSCVYCFAGQGPYGGEASLMNKPTAQRAIDVFLDQPSVAAKPSITFFGGEPLLNVPVIEFAIAYATREAAKRGKQISFTITTNGTLLSRRIVDLLKQHHVSIMVSIDGPKGIQDQLRRPRRSNRSSYDMVAARMKMLSQACPDHLAARATITHFNPDVRAITRHLELMGFPRVYCA
ncbi:MAG TPA: 4Fe-4S cluster-binding domain-containing protein, partial [Anaerolineae bacterium]|nr:4Fe-4S cluster-binding domain-containing protein [Anaerolineae bacterium]